MCSVYINLDNKQLGYLFFLILTSTFSAHVARIEGLPQPAVRAQTQAQTQIKSFTHTNTYPHTQTDGETATVVIFVAILQAMGSGWYWLCSVGGSGCVDARMRGVQLNHINNIAKIYNCVPHSRSRGQRVLVCAWVFMLASSIHLALVILTLLSQNTLHSC